MYIILAHAVVGRNISSLYLNDWERSVNARQGFSNAEKMLNTETFLGLRMTSMYTCVHAVHITFLFIQQSRLSS